MKQITTKEKLLKGKKITDGPLKIALRDISYRLFLKAAQSKIKYTIVKDNQLEKIQEHPIIYVVNHYSSQDTPIICNSIENRAYILAGKQPLRFEDNIFFKKYGSIFVDRKDKEDMQLSKVAMEDYLRKKRSLIVFPEGTWNLDDALLMLQMKWGIIDIAKNTNAQIIPVILNYDRKLMDCHIQYGKPRLIAKDSKNAEEIALLRDDMATMIWSYIEKGETLTRRNSDVEKLRKEFQAVIDEYPKLDAQYEREVIFHAYPTPEKVFEPIKKLELKKENCFLFHKNNKGMY